MNEHIRQFERESHIDVYALGRDRAQWEAALTKFAELIIQTCSDVVTDAVDHREPASTYADKIKQHFGVEE